MKIKFYYRKKTWGWLSNFERSPQIVDELIYPTNEHYYQSQKAKDPKVQEWIRQAPSAWLAMKAGRSLRDKEKHETWEQSKFAIMKKGLLAKFSQNQELKERLLATKDSSIHEDSPTDLIWGIKGKDMLGKLLMEVRAEIQ
jgi:N-glycosidase YbiA